ncbi:hypothetical protein VTH06DRAFT_6194 [Thermothelomyces fergusii]
MAKHGQTRGWRMNLAPPGRSGSLLPLARLSRDKSTPTARYSADHVVPSEGGKAYRPRHANQRFGLVCLPNPPVPSASRLHGRHG